MQRMELETILGILVFSGVGFGIITLMERSKERESKQARDFARLENLKEIKIRDYFREVFPDYYKKMSPESPRRLSEKLSTEIQARTMSIKYNAALGQHEITSDHLTTDDTRAISYSLASLVSVEFYEEISSNEESQIKFYNLLSRATIDSMEKVYPHQQNTK